MSDHEINEHSVLEIITDHYLQSSDQNGVPASQVCQFFCKTCKLTRGTEKHNYTELSELFSSPNPCKEIGNTHEMLKEKLVELVDKAFIEIIYDLNPHIKRFPAKDKSIQINYIKNHFKKVCLYPSSSTLSKKIPENKYKDSPYSRIILEGEAQLSFRFFELEVLEIYANDPRFTFNFHDFGGSIYFAEQESEANYSERDHTHIPSFGISYRQSDGRKMAAAWSRDLAALTPEHQQRWKTFEASDCLIDEDYWRTQIEAEFPAKHSIYEAFLEEIKVINKFCELNSLPALFREVFSYEDRPSLFRYPFRATKAAFLASIEEMDKLLSQNLNRKFFDKVLFPNETYIVEKHNASDTSVPKDFGTLKLLEVWIESRFKPSPGENRTLLDPLKIFKKLRDIRIEPAHKIIKDEHNNYYYDEHDSLLKEAYIGLRHLRLIISNLSPSKTNSIVPEWLINGEIRTFSKLIKKS